MAFLSLRVYLVYGHLSSLNFDLDSSCPPSHLPKRQPVSYAAKWQWARARSLMSSTALAHDRFLTPQSRYSADRDTEASAGMSYSQLPNAQILFFLGGGRITEKQTERRKSFLMNGKRLSAPLREYSRLFGPFWTFSTPVKGRPRRNKGSGSKRRCFRHVTSPATNQHQRRHTQANQKCGHE